MTPNEDKAKAKKKAHFDKLYALMRQDEPSARRVVDTWFEKRPHLLYKFSLENFPPRFDLYVAVRTSGHLRKTKMSEFLRMSEDEEVFAELKDDERIEIAEIAGKLLNQFQWKCATRYFEGVQKYVFTRRQS